MQIKICHNEIKKIKFVRLPFILMSQTNHKKYSYMNKIVQSLSFLTGIDKLSDSIVSLIDRDESYVYRNLTYVK